MRLIGFAICVLALLASLGPAGAQGRTYSWSDIDCHQSRIAAWPGLKCRATNIVTNDSNIGTFRQWSAFGTTREGYYVHMFVWEAENDFSYLSADETTAQFVKWMYEFGRSMTRVSPVASYKHSDFVTFLDSGNQRGCIGFRRVGGFQRGGYDSITGGILCAPPGKALGSNDVPIFIDSVHLQAPMG